MRYILRRNFEVGEERHITGNGTKHLIGGGGGGKFPPSPLFLRLPFKFFLLVGAPFKKLGGGPRLSPF